MSRRTGRRRRRRRNVLYGEQNSTLFDLTFAACLNMELQVILRDMKV